MDKLDMIKAFADLEGIEVHLEMEGKPDAYWYSEELSKEYEPTEDFALNCRARDKYEVSIEYGEYSDFISIGLDFYSEVMDKNVIPKSVIECILKSKGLWVG